MFTGIPSVAVYTADLPASRAFYTGVLGFEVSADLGPDLCFLRSASGRIHIVLEGGKRRGGTSPESTRLSFFLQSERSAKETFDALRALGVSILQDAPEAVSDDTACFQFLDPDGNILEVSAPIRP